MKKESIKLKNWILRKSVPLCLLMSGVFTVFDCSAKQDTIKTSPRAAYHNLINGDYEQSIIEYEAMLSTENEDPTLHFNLGIAYFHSFRFSSAQRSFERALLLSIENPDFQAMAEYNIGITMFEQAKLYAEKDFDRTLNYIEEAIQSFENTIELAPEWASAKQNLTLCVALRNQLQENQNSSPTEDSDDESNRTEKSDKSPQPADSNEPESEKGNDSSPDESQGAGDPSQARTKENPTTTDKVAGQPGAQRLGVQEALMLLDSIEKDEKRITLSELMDPMTKTTKETEANW